MPTKTTIFIIILGLITAGLIYVAFVSMSPSDQDTEKTTQEQTAPVEEEAEKTSLLYFEQEQITATPGARTTANILLDSGGQEVSGAQVVLKFDPAQITLTSIEAPQDNFFGASPSEYLVLPTEPIDNTQGRATFSISTQIQLNNTQPVTSKPLTGTDTVAQVTFTVNSTLEQPATIEIVNNPESTNTSIITISDPNHLTDNILLDTTPLTITTQ